MSKSFKFIIYLFIIVLFFQYLKYNDFKEYQIPKDTQVTIKSWDTPTKFFKDELGLNKYYLKISWIPKEVTNLQKWIYSFSAWDDLQTIIQKLNKWPSVEQISVTFLPWRNIFDIDACLSNPESKKIISKNWEELSCINKKDKNWKTTPIFLWLIQAWEYIKEARNIDNYKEKYSFLSNKYSLEWYLFPDTFFINPANYSVESIIEKQLSTFKTKVYDNLLTSKSNTKIDEIIKIASILEREEKSKIQQPTVAWILIKRYNENWMIWADITACYPFEYTDDECRMNLSKHIREKNDYNTRTMYGLPKTPINNPSYDTIFNTINYKTSPYYFYLHNVKTWKIYYWITNEDHNYNKQFMD